PGALEVLVEVPKAFAQLTLTACELGPKDFDSIGRMTNLRRLYLERCRFDERGLGKLGALVKLESIVVGGTDVGDAGVEALGKLALPALKELELDATRVTDAGLPALAALTKLARLDIRDTAVTDAGILALACLPKLELSVAGTKVTKAGLAAFLKAQKAGGKLPASPPIVSKVEQREIAHARARWLAYLDEMAAWERRCAKDGLRGPVLAKAHNEIWTRFWIPDAKSRGITYRDPPEHDPKRWSVVEASLPKPGVVEIVATRRTEAEEERRHRFLLKKVAGEYRLAGRHFWDGRWVAR
ncbi:MAG: hypothetical protein IT379_26415, partial [Deltaproteobacteria bacterium]|nr:hypothetical protein [Deltaproteobacteria bacterium]